MLELAGRPGMRAILSREEGEHNDCRDQEPAGSASEDMPRSQVACAPVVAQ